LTAKVFIVEAPLVLYRALDELLDDLFAKMYTFFLRELRDRSAGFRFALYMSTKASFRIKLKVDPNRYIAANCSNKPVVVFVEHECAAKASRDAAKLLSNIHRLRTVCSLNTTADEKFVRGAVDAMGVGPPLRREGCRLWKRIWEMVLDIQIDGRSNV
jgi:hypothetical protein